MTLIAPAFFICRKLFWTKWGAVSSNKYKALKQRERSSQMRHENDTAGREKKGQMEQLVRKAMKHNKEAFEDLMQG